MVVEIDELSFVRKMLSEHRGCSICRGSGLVDGKMCKCLYRLKLAMNGCGAGVPQKKIRNIIIDGLIEKQVRIYSFPTSRWGNTVNLNEDVIDPYLADLPQMIQDSRSFLFLGANSTGKTITMSHLISQVAYRQYSSMFLRFDRFLRAYWNQGLEPTDPHLVDYALNCTFLAIDELGKQRAREGVVGVLEMILKEREEGMKPTFIASNKNIQEFREDYGVSVFSLLKENYSIFEFDPRKDYRLEKRSRGI